MPPPDSTPCPWNPHSKSLLRRLALSLLGFPASLVPHPERTRNPMSAAVKSPKAREAKKVPPPGSVAAPAAEAAPADVYAPDCWGFRFWLGCAGLLVLLQVLDMLNGLFRH